MERRLRPELLLMLGVFALVVMTSVLDGIKDKISSGFAESLGWSRGAAHPTIG